MNTRGLLGCAGAVVALSTASACAGSPTTPVAPSAAIPNAGYHTAFHDGMLFLDGKPVTAERLSPLPPYAQLVPMPKKAKDYEYVFNYYQSYASIFDYPKSVAMIGQIQGAGGQGCTNVLYGYGKKIFWNAGRTGDVMTEYQVPSKQIRTLPIPYDYTSSCAMNTNGDLAVGILLSNSYSAGGQQVIFKNATGKGKVYNTPLHRAFFAGYDPKGNLFADGQGANNAFQLIELPKGKKHGVTIKTSNAPAFPGSVQWDGTYMTVFDQGTGELYQYTISGTNATLQNTVQLTGSGDCTQTWIVPGLIYCGDAGNNGGEVFKYPAGGQPLASFTGTFDEPLGVVAAQK